MSRHVVYPGEALQDGPVELCASQAAFARPIVVPPNRMSQTIVGRQAEKTGRIATPLERALRVRYD